MDRKPQYYQDVMSFQLVLYIQCNSSQNPNKLFYKYCQIDSKIYMERHNIEWEEKAGGLMLPDLKT